MTREEALKEIPHQTGTIEGTEELINKIYDDFEEAIDKTLDAAKYTESAELVRTLILQMKETK